jgi:branched-chain amino acid transport system ATP-binding protein
MSLSVSGLSARYARIAVCHDITFDVAKGEVLAVLGANGAGKSSLLGAIAGLVTATGRISVNGRAIEAMSARGRARSGIAFVPEARRNLFAPLTVEENLQLGLRLAPQGERHRVRAGIDQLFPILARRGGQPAGALSGGEQQMLALAVAIARQPSLLLLDEPSQGLAPVVLEEIAAAVKGLRALGVTLLLAEQNHLFASGLADRFIVLRSGEIVDEGDGAALTCQDRVAAAIMRH